MTLVCLQYYPMCEWCCIVIKANWNLKNKEKLKKAKRTWKNYLRPQLECGMLSEVGGRNGDSPLFQVGPYLWHVGAATWHHMVMVGQWAKFVIINCWTHKHMQYHIRYCDVTLKCSILFYSIVLSTYNKETGRTTQWGKQPQRHCHRHLLGFSVLVEAESSNWRLWEQSKKSDSSSIRGLSLNSQ